MMQGVLLELNDCGVSCENGDVSVVSPGYALLARDRIITGDAAREKLFVSPQSSFSQFWQQLNLSPLAVKTPLARHNADLAFAHLNDVLESAGQPAEVVIAVPGSFSREQLGILLGLAQAAKVQVAGLLDSSVLAGHQLPKGAYWYLDIQLHQLVATHLLVADKVTRGEVIIQPSLGLRTLHELWAHIIGEQFINQYRYDPLHNAKGEQQLHDRLPGWLETLKDTREISVSLSSSQGDYQLNLDRTALVGVVSDRFSKLQIQLAHTDVCPVVLSHRLAALPGVREFFANPDVLASNAIALGYSAHAANLLKEGDAVKLITELPARSTAPAEVSSGDRSAKKELVDREIASDVTHLLCRGVAYPLAESLGINSTSGALHHQSDSVSPILHRNDGKWFLSTIQPGGLLACGEQVEVAGHLLTLIRVED